MSADNIKRLADEYRNGAGWTLSNRAAFYAAIDALAAEAEALRADAARLDWLDKNPRKVKYATGYLNSHSSWLFVSPSGIRDDAISLRSAIDAAISASQEPKT